MAIESKENYYNWRHFLSSLKKTTKNYFTPEKQKKDVFLGNIDCFSTNLSRQLLGTSGQNIKTELSPSALKKLKTSGRGYDMKHDYIPDVPGSKPLKKTAFKHASNDTKYQTASKGFEVEKTDSKFSDEFEERKPKDDVSDIVKVELGPISSEVLRKQSTEDIEPDMYDYILDNVKVESNPISTEVLRKKTTELIEPVLQKTSSEDVKMEEKLDSKVSEKKSKVAEKAAPSRSGLFSSINRLEGKATAASLSPPDKTVETNGKKQDFEEHLYQNVPPVEEKKVRVPIVLASEAFSEINENIETNRVRQRYTNKNKRKVDVDTPCSQWTLEMLSKYVDFKQSVGEIEEKMELGHFQNTVDRIVKQILCQIEAVQQVIFDPHKSSLHHRQTKPGSGDIYDFSHIRGTEADVRILLDAILIPFAKEMQLNIETEKSYKNNNLPNCTFDYRIHYKNDVVGVVEAKSRLYGSGIGPESVVQGILQLSALQAEVYGRMAKASPTNQHIDPLTLFSIISDGYQFIFIQLNRHKLLFNHQPDTNVYGEDMPTIKYYVMDSRNGMEEILVKIAKQLLEAINWVPQEEEDESVEMEGEEEVDEYEIDDEGRIILD